MSMKTTLGSSWFVALGASAIVFIGAFAHFDPVAPLSPTTPPATFAVAAEQVAPEPAATPASVPESSEPMAQVIRLAESHVDPGVILAYIQNSGLTYSPTADQILYLSHLGVPQNVITALFPAKSEQLATMAEAAPASAPEAVPPQDANSNVFAGALAPYGNWVHVPDYGDAWQPAEEASIPDWRPYVDGGEWINSDSGWYWQSDYPWGWAPFHYGGWINASQLGWVWVPGTTWGPGWVSWRSTKSWVGWAPLPPGVSLNVLAQLTFSGHPVTPDYDFGISLSSYVFVRASHFLNSDLPTHVAPAGRAGSIAASSAVINNYSVVNNRVVNGGVSRGVVAAASRQPPPEVPLEPVSGAPSYLAAAREDESASPAMQLPPLRGPAPMAPSGRHMGPRGYGAGPSDRPRYGRPDQPPPPGPARPGEENRSAPPAPVRSVASGGSSGGKSAK
jgi:hypothetical protein